MSGYFGTETQRRLQATAEANDDFIKETPGACQVGRMIGCDDPERLGWERIGAILDRDGICGFRLIPADRVGALRSRLAERGFRLDTWDLFLADRATALAASQAILSRGLPDGLTEMAQPTDPEGEDTRRIQALIGAAGVVPFSGSLLAGALGPATTIALGDAAGAVVATAHGYRPHNRHSAFHGHAWGGLVAVADTHRGKGLGAHVNALMIAGVFRDPGATHVYELVSATNMPSRHMVAACGLRPEPALVCGMAMPGESTRFTR